MFGSKIKKKELKSNNSLIKIWTVTIPSDIMTDLVEKEITKAASSLSAPGFRKGHVPIKVLIEQYGEQALKIAIDNKMQDMANEIVKEEKYTLAFSPNANIISEIKSGEKIEFKIEFTLLPNIPEIKYEKLGTFDLIKVKLTENEKKSELEKFALRLGTLKEVTDEDYLTKNGDVVEISFIGKINDIPFDNGSADSYNLELGSKSFIDTFEDQLINKKKSTDVIIVNVRFPDEYHQANLAGQNATFDVVIKKIMQKELPVLDDEFAKKSGIESIEKLTEILCNNIEQTINNYQEKELETKIFDKIITVHSFEVPSNILDNEIKARFHNALEKKTDLQFEDFVEKEGNVAKKAIQLWYLTQNIGRKENIVISDEEVKTFVTTYALSNRLDVKQELSKIEKDKEYLNDIKSTIFQNKVAKFVLSKIKQNIIELSKKEFDAKQK